VKLADSASLSQREAGLETLVIATLLAGKEQQHAQNMRTLKYLVKKNKNQPVANRAKTLEIILAPNGAVEAFLENAEYLPIWSEMLSDALESQDLDELGAKEYNEVDNHVVLKHFITVSLKALEKGAHDISGNPLFEFGIDIQWKIALFRLGEKKAAEEFLIRIPTHLIRRGANYARHPEIHFPVSAENQFVTGWLKAYSTRIAERHPKYLDTCSSAHRYYSPLFSVIGKNAEKVPELSQHLNNAVDDLKQLVLTKEQRQEAKQKLKKEQEEKETKKEGKISLDKDVKMRVEDDDDDEIKFLSANEVGDLINDVLNVRVDDYETLPIVNKITTVLLEILNHPPEAEEETEETKQYNEIEKLTSRFFDELVNGCHKAKEKKEGRTISSEQRDWSAVPVIHDFGLKLIQFFASRP